MANNEEKKKSSGSKLDKLPASALDAAIAAAISAPKPPKKAGQFQKQKSDKKRDQRKQPAQSKSEKQENKKLRQKEQLRQREQQRQKEQRQDARLDRPAEQNSDRQKKRQISSRSPVGTVGKNPLKIIPLGGLNEIGKNMTLIEYGNDIVIIDC